VDNQRVRKERWKREMETFDHVSSSVAKWPWLPHIIQINLLSRFFPASSFWPACDISCHCFLSVCPSYCLNHQTKGCPRRDLQLFYYKI
jgi:hypothetical protein